MENESSATTKEIEDLRAEIQKTKSKICAIINLCECKLIGINRKDGVMILNVKTKLAGLSELIQELVNQLEKEFKEAK